MPKKDFLTWTTQQDFDRVVNAVRLGKQAMLPRTVQARHERVYGHVLTFGCCAARPKRMTLVEPEDGAGD